MPQRLMISDRSWREFKDISLEIVTDQILPATVAVNNIGNWRHDLAES